MTLDKITFVMENCDTITIDGKYIGDFEVDDIRTSISRVACNAIMKMEVAHLVFIEVHKDGNEKYHEFGQNDSSFEIEKFKRLLGDDITAIEFDLVDPCVEDGKEPRREHYEYYVHWIGPNEYVNASSHTFVSDLGHLYIFIGPEEKLNELVDKDVLNNQGDIDFKFKMYGIGYENWLEEQKAIKEAKATIDDEGGDDNREEKEEE